MTSLRKNCAEPGGSATSTELLMNLPLDGLGALSLLSNNHEYLADTLDEDARFYSTALLTLYAC